MLDRLTVRGAIARRFDEGLESRGFTFTLLKVT
jgi:hypothetical protein